MVAGSYPEVAAPRDILTKEEDDLVEFLREGPFYDALIDDTERPALASLIVRGVVERVYLGPAGLLGLAHIRLKPEEDLNDADPNEGTGRPG